MSSPRRLKTVILLILLFIISFILCDRLLFLGLRQGMAGNYASVPVGAFHWAQPVGRGDKQALILGTSRAQIGFAGETLSRLLGAAVQNEAGPGRYPQFHYHLYRAYRAKFPPPKVVVFGLDYFMFEKNSTGLGLVRVDKKLLLARMDPAKSTNPGSPLLSRASWLFRMKPRIDELLINFWDFDRTAARDDQRAGADAGPNIKPVPKGKPRIGQGVFTTKPRRWRSRAYAPFSGQEGVYFQRLLGDLDREGIPTFLVFIPEYIGTFETNFEQSKFKDDIRRIASGCKSVHVLDFDSPQAFDLGAADMFWNGGWGYSNSHLGEQGALLFSEKLGLAINNILERNPVER